MRIKRSAATGLVLAITTALIPITSYSTMAAGPQTPSCGNYKLATNEVIVGVQFSKGSYQINSSGISCSKVMGSKGLFAQFLKLKDSDPLPKPWYYLGDAIGAPKFSSGSGIGFRVQLITPIQTSAPAPSQTLAPAPSQTLAPAPSQTSGPTTVPTPESESSGSTCSRNRNALRNC
jgi:hypothetical protein